ncbi:MAG: plasmid mobilization relaxosome protein MobC [Clostridia bacterium]|nr:plasmid mobilization relaxosome protein MobC [Clostridia bacterium]
MGRKRNKQLWLGMTEAEQKLFDDEYIKSGCKSRADFVLRLLADKPIVVVTDMTDILTELRRQGTNLNQLARIANTYGYTGEELTAAIRVNTETKIKLMELAEEVRQCRFSKERAVKRDRKKQ